MNNTHTKGIENKLYVSFIRPNYQNYLHIKKLYILGIAFLLHATFINAQEHCQDNAVIHYEGQKLVGFCTSFVNDSLGYAIASDITERGNNTKVDSNIILKTDNQGKDWHPVSCINKSFSIPRYTIDFCDTKRGFLTVFIGATTSINGNPNTTYQTVDGGLSWSEFDTKRKFQLLSYQKNVAIFTKADSLYIYTSELTSLKIPEVTTIKTAQVLNDSTLVILCEKNNTLYGYIIQYSDFTWKIKNKFSYASGDKNNFGLYFKSEGNGFFWNNALLCKMQNGLISSVSTPQKIENLKFLGDTLLLVSRTAIHYSTDQGSSWFLHPYSGITPSYFKYCITHFFTFKGLAFANPNGLSWIHPYENTPLQILKQPDDVFVKENCNTSFGVLATEGVKYQWYFNDKKLDYKTQDSLFVEGCTLANEGNYYCLLSNPCTSLKTVPARLSLKKAVEIQRQPQSQEVCLGADIRLSIHADSVSYQWTFKDLPISGAQDSVFIISNFQQANLGDYRCILTDMDCGKTLSSNIATLKEKTNIGKIPHPLASLTKICTNTNLVFDIGTVSNAIAYTWYKGDALLENTNPQLQINSVSAKDTGLYICKITGSCGGEEYQKSQVVLHPNLKIIAYSDTLIHCTEDIQIDTLWIKVEHAISYQWKDRKSDLYEVKDSSLILPLSCSTNNHYWCEVKGYCENIKMPPIVLTRPVKIEKVSLTPNVICPEDTNQIYLYKAQGSDNISTYQWFEDGILLKDSIRNYLHVGYNSANTYTCKGLSSYCQSSTYDAPKVAFHADPPNMRRLPLDTTLYYCAGYIPTSELLGGPQPINGESYRVYLKVTRTQDVLGTYHDERRTLNGNCFFDQLQIKIVPVVFLTPLEQYISDTHNIKSISGINLKAYSQDNYSYRWKFKEKGNWQNVENSENTPFLIPSKTAESSSFYPEIISPTSQCSSDTASVHIVGNRGAENDSSWFLVQQFSTPLNTLCFTDDQTGYVGGDQGFLLKTTNGGKDWAHIDMLIGSKRPKFKVTHLRTYDGNQIFLSVGNGNAISYDMGDTWIWTHESASECFWLNNRIYPISPTQSILISEKWTGFQEVSAKTTTHQLCPPSCSAWMLLDIAAPPSYLQKKKGAIAVGFDGTIRLQRSFDYCNYEEVSKNLVYRAFSVTFISDDTVFVACSNGKLLYSTKGGERDSWKIIQSPVNDNLLHIQFLDSKVGFVAGENGVFLKTVDGGKTWQAESVGTHDHITDFYMFSEDIGYIVTQQGKLLKKNATLRKKDDLTIQSPSSIQACSGEAVLLTVKSENATYFQWYRNNIKLKDFSEATMQVKASSSTAGIYTCVVGNATTELTTTPATLTVLSFPIIQTQPTNQTGFVGEKIKLSVQGSFAQTYQWYKDEAKINGANQIDIVFSSVQLRDAGSYYCVLSNSCGLANSNKTKLIVNAYEAEKAYIVESPTDKDICLSEDLSLSLVAVNAKSYQWKYNGENIENANTATLVISNIAADQLGIYTCEVKGTENTVLSSPAKVREYSIPTCTFEDDTVYAYQEGSYLMLEFQFNNTVSYQWYKNGEVLKDLTEVNLSIPNLKLSDSGYYNCLAYGHCNTSTQSPNIYIKVISPITKDSLTITGQPQNKIVCPKETVTFKVVAPKAISFQWYKANVPIGSATQSTLTITSAQPEDVATYYCLLSNEYDSVCSDSVRLDLKPLPIINRQPPENIELSVGDSISLHVQASYADTYLWTFTNKPIPHPSSQTATLFLENITLKEAGKYVCRITNECEGIDTKNIYIKVKDTIPTSIETSFNPLGIKLYPNPATELVTIESPFSIIEIKITDMWGKIVWDNNYQRSKVTEKIIFSVKTFSKGLYLVKITSKDNKTVFIKLLKH